jgi:ABC-type multidrug transport system ATPase subunit
MTQVENLTKYYGDLAAIQDFSFNVDKGGVNYSG